jgi:hypothetical protein
MKAARAAREIISCVVMEVSVIFDKNAKRQGSVARGLLILEMSSDIYLEHSQASTARTLAY